MIPMFSLMLGCALAPAVQEAAFREKVDTLASSTRKVWEAELPRESAVGIKYKAPGVMLFQGKVATACGTAEGGPFYCPADSTIYVEREFFAAIDTRLQDEKAKCAKAYVFAWLAAKDVMNQAGFLKLVDAKRRTPQEDEYRVRAGLCVSYLAGVWAHHAQKDHKYLNPKHAEEAITTVRALGDDRIMRRQKGLVQESWTHGTAEQHVRFFSEGMKTGDASKTRIERFFSAKFDAKTATLADE